MNMIFSPIQKRFNNISSSFSPPKETNSNWMKKKQYKADLFEFVHSKAPTATLNSQGTQDCHRVVLATTAFHAKAALGAQETIFCGLLAGCVTRTSVAPLDVLKIVVQLQNLPGGAYNKSSIQIIQNIYSEEGLRGLWKGNAAGCCRLAPYSASKFVTFDFLKSRYSNAQGQLSNSQRVAYGGVSGVVATVLTYPMELIRTKLIAQNSSIGNITGIIDGLKKLYYHEGIKGWYRGGVTAIVGVIPFEGVQFGCYELMKEYAIGNKWPHWQREANKTELSSLDYMVIGGISGAISQTITYPLDSIKKYLQVDSGSKHRQYKGMVDCCRSIIKKEGVNGLFRGVGVNMVRIVPYSAVMFTSYECMKNFVRSFQ